MICMHKISRSYVKHYCQCTLLINTQNSQENFGVNLSTVHCTQCTALVICKTWMLRCFSGVLQKCMQRHQYMVSCTYLAFCYPTTISYTKVNDKIIFEYIQMWQSLFDIAQNFMLHAMYIVKTLYCQTLSKCNYMCSMLNTIYVFFPEKIKNKWLQNNGLISFCTCLHGSCNATYGHNLKLANDIIIRDAPILPANLWNNRFAKAKSKMLA